MDGRAFLRTLRNSVGNSPAAATVLARHLARGTQHVGGLPQPWRTPAYVAAVAALERGELAEAERLAGAAGPAGAVLRRVVAGELGLLTSSAPPAPADRTPAGPPAGSAELHGAAPGDELAAGDGGGLHRPHSRHRPGTARPRARRPRRHPDRVSRHEGPPRRGHEGDRRRDRAPPGAAHPAAAARRRRPGPGHRAHRPARGVPAAGRAPRAQQPRQRPRRARAARALRDPGGLRGARLPRGDLAQPLDRSVRRLGRRLPAGPGRRDAVPACGRRGRHAQRGHARGDRGPRRGPGQGHGRPELRRPRASGRARGTTCGLAPSRHRSRSAPSAPSTPTRASTC